MFGTVRTVNQKPFNKTIQHWISTHHYRLHRKFTSWWEILLFVTRWHRSTHISGDDVFLTPAIHFLYFAFHRYFANVFTKHATKYEILIIHFLHFMRISCFINAAKFFDFSREWQPWCKMLWNAKSKKKTCKMWKSGGKYPAIHFLFFAFCDRFCVFRDKCSPPYKNFLTTDSFPCATLVTMITILDQWMCFCQAI